MYQCLLDYLEWYLKLPNPGSYTKSNELIANLRVRDLFLK